MTNLFSSTFKTVFGAALSFTMMATIAQAQDTRWRVITEFGQATGQVAAFCPQTTVNGAPATCFGLVCPASSPMAWAIVVPDASLGTAFQGAVTIDGQSYGSLSFTQQRSGANRTFYVSSFDSNAHAPLMAAVRAGNTMNMTLTTASGTQTFPQVSLAGSTAALDTIAPACRL